MDGAAQPAKGHRISAVIALTLAATLSLGIEPLSAYAQTSNEKDDGLMASSECSINNSRYKDLSFLESLGLPIGEMSASFNAEANQNEYVFHFDDIDSLFVIQWDNENNASITITENGSSAEMVVTKDGRLFDNGIEVVEGETIDLSLGANQVMPYDMAGSFFTSTNPLPSGRTWNSTVQSTSTNNDIPLSQQVGLYKVGELATALGKVCKPLKAIGATSKAASKIIKYANDHGYQTSKHLSSKTKVYYPNNGRRISANGVTPVRYEDKYVTWFYAKKNCAGGAADKRTAYKITEIG